MSQSVSKRYLWRHVNIKIKRAIHHYHVFSVISILFEEMTKDLLAGKEVKIANFGSFILKQMPARKYFNVNLQKMTESPGNKIMRLFLTKKLRTKLCNFLDLDSLIKKDYNE
jgi:nucleoid DNA-binding protein